MPPAGRSSARRFAGLGKKAEFRQTQAQPLFVKNTHDDAFAMVRGQQDTRKSISLPPAEV